jgi:hypothetical protein
MEEMRSLGVGGSWKKVDLRYERKKAKYSRGKV